MTNQEIEFRNHNELDISFRHYGDGTIVTLTISNGLGLRTCNYTLQKKLRQGSYLTAN